ncbi:hypothetical protein [Methylophilus sp. Leaf408]|jgi:predicted transcriptional regulator|uniref:hypothetical protein n=1 Tax=Methylophilus sp. Leaf408 TaxID=2876561 RepID=UPI001E3AC1DD|nr:hypothetical protein [Methylophilus sp. Leaf408]
MLLDYDQYDASIEESISVDHPDRIDPSPLDTSAVRMLGILALLHAEHGQGRAQVPLAAICKRLELRMSTLQRLMTALSEQQLVDVMMEKERLVAALTPAGEEITLALQSA